MAGFDPDVFGGGTAPGFDPEVFASPKMPPITVPPPSEPPARPSMDVSAGMLDRVKNYDPTNAIAGQLRGAGSIGATLLAPVDWAAQKLGISNSVIGRDDRRAQMDEALRAGGADPQSTQFQTNKLMAEVAGTSGIGSMVANGLRMIPGASQWLPTLIPAIESGGMSVNGAKGLYGLANRVAGGAVNGYATAGLVDPANAKEGGMIGGALPVAVKGAQYAGNTLGGMFASKPITPALAQTARDSIEAGYVIPPNMVKPSLGSQAIESISGKQATQQLASVRNNETTDRLVRESLGIPSDVPLSQGTLENLRKTAGKAYSEVSSLSPQAATDLEALKQARNDAQAWFKAYNRSASPSDLATAKQYRATADQLETAMEQHAQAASRPDLIPALRDARKQIAKSYTVGRAMNDAAGTVDARVLGRMYEKGLPLSDGLETAGRFGSAFPTIAKTPQQIGSPAAHNLKAGLAALTGGVGAGGGAMIGGPMLASGLGALGAAIPFVAPAAARSVMFSRPVQRALAAPGSSYGLLAQAADEVLPLAYRSAGLLANAGQ